MDHEVPFLVVDISPDGRYVAAGSRGGGVVLWDWANEKNGQHFLKHTGNVNSIAFSPDGRYLATASGDKIVRVHYLKPEDLVEETRARLPQDLNYPSLFE